MHKYIKHFFTLSIFIFITMISFSSGLKASGNVLGFAWADGVGWISLSSDNDHNPDLDGIQFAPYDFGINVPSSNGPITGYAWSDNLGWIRFDGGCPDGTHFNEMAGTFCGAYKYGSEWRGFAKIVNVDGGDQYCFLPATQNNDNCGTSDAESASYISLSKHNDQDRVLAGPQKSTVNNPPNQYLSDYGPVQNTNGVVSGFAWNPLVGWIEFYGEGVEIPVPDSPLGLSGGGTYCPGDIINTELTWTAQNLSCSATWTTVIFETASTSSTITAPTASTDYTLSCQGVSDTEQIIILDANDSQCTDIPDGDTPVLSSNTQSMCVNEPQNPITLEWSSPANSCSGTWDNTLPGIGFAQVNVPLSPGSYNYNVTCDGLQSNTVTIDVFSANECATGEGGDEGGDNSGGGKPIFEEF